MSFKKRLFDFLLGVPKDKSKENPCKSTSAYEATMAEYNKLKAEAEKSWLTLGKMAEGEFSFSYEKPTARQALHDHCPALSAFVSCPDTHTRMTYGWNELLMEIEVIEDGVVPCPSKSSLWYMIQHLNDTHEWTREAIADWIETLDLDIEIKNGEQYDEVGSEGR